MLEREIMLNWNKAPITNRKFITVHLPHLTNIREN